MKKFWTLVAAAVMATCLLAGCVGEIKTYIDSGQTVNIGVDQEFVIALGANPTTGYDWQETYDETMLELVEKIYKLPEEAEHEVVGAGGVDYFRFKALEAGETEISLVYQRSWEEEGTARKVFIVNIK